MSETLMRILVIDANRIRASIIEEGLREAGFAACGGGVFVPPGSTVVLYALERGRDR